MTIDSTTISGFCVVLFYCAICALVGMMSNAKGQGRSFGFCVSFLLSPFIGVIIVSALGTNHAGLTKAALRSGKMKKCPACAEAVLKEAQVCRYCRHSFVSLRPSTPPGSSGSVYAVAQNGQEIGKLTLSDILQRVRNGALRMEDYYFDEVAQDWQPVQRLLN